VHHAVEAPRGVDHGGHRGPDGIRVEHVEHQVVEPISTQTGGRIAVEVDTDHGGTLADQPLDRGLADTRCRAGDQHTLALEPAHHPSRRSPPDITICTAQRSPTHYPPTVE
jgi:hypothetical protein